MSYDELKSSANNPLEKTGLPCRKKTVQFDTVVVGGGMAGVCAAIAAARHGAKTVLIQDRPVLGGNASSEIRVCVNGASTLDADGNRTVERETGIIEEILLANRKFNPQDSYEVWDHIVYDIVDREENLSIMMNTQAVDAVMDGDRIAAALCWQSTTETEFTVNAKVFIDCSGDGLLAAAAGAVYRTGREAAGEFDESYAPEQADGWQMGASLLLSTRDMGEPTPFEPPGFTIKFDLEKNNRSIGGSLRQGYWWVELGSDDDIIADQEKNRHKLMGYLFGVWDYIKNSGKYPEAENLALDWLGAVPGRRESRRFVGDYMFSQRDMTEYRHFDDAIAYGGWPIDEHVPGGIENPHDPPTWFHHHFDKIYQFPFRSIYSKNISNLMFAGRNASCTHIALSSTRIIATCSLMGQAAGTAASLCLKYDATPRQVGNAHIKELQQLLISDDVFIPDIPADGAGDLARQSVVTASSTSSGDVKLLVDGVSRDENNECHYWQSDGLDAVLTLEWDAEIKLSEVWLKLDTNLRKCLWKVMKDRDRSVKFTPDKLPEELVKTFEIEVLADGRWRPVAGIDNNCKRMVKLRFVPVRAKAMRIVFKETYGAADVKVFEVRCY